MINFSDSNGNKFCIPSGLQDITLQQYIDYVTLIEPTAPDEYKELVKLNAETDEGLTKKDIEERDKKIGELIEILDNPLYRSKKLIPFYARVVSFWSGMSEKYILGKDGGLGMNVAHLTTLYLKLLELISKLPEVDYSNVMEVGGELWYLPERFMQDSTVIEFAEAAQFQANLSKVLGGDWLSMAKVMCVLVRKKDEQYNDKLLKREKMFLSWNMLDVWRVAFFLLRRSETYKVSMLCYMNALKLSRLRQALAN